MKYKLKYFRVKFGLALLLFMFIVIWGGNELSNYLYKDYFIKMKEIFVELNKPIDTDNYEDDFVRVFKEADSKKDFEIFLINVEMISD